MTARPVPTWPILERVVVVGCAGSGKTTLAREVAARLDAWHIERDALGDDEAPGFAVRVAAAVQAAGRRWVFDGAPYSAEALVYPHADAPVGDITRSGGTPPARRPGPRSRGPAADRPRIAAPALTGIGTMSVRCRPADVSPAMPVAGDHIGPRGPGTMPGHAGTAPSVLAPYAHLDVSRDRP